MKKLALNMILIAVMAGTAQAQHKVECDGAESTGSGSVSCDATPRAYAYPVTAAPTAPVDKLKIGTDDCNLAMYTNVCMPTGWTLKIRTTKTTADNIKTAHGAATSATPSGSSLCKLEFDVGTGTAIAAGTSFTFGFDNPNSSHDVGWLASGLAPAVITSQTWGSLSGDGVGPVHGPRDVFIPAVSQWGLAALVLLVLSAGTIVILRQRKTATV